LYNEIAQNRYKLLIQLENECKAKIITIVGISVNSRLDNRAADKAIRNLQKVGTNKEIIIFLNTFGGEIEAGWRIAREILGRSSKTTIIVTHVAKSTGTLISLAGTEIIARQQSEFGPTDPQIPVYRDRQLVYLPALTLVNSSSEPEKIEAERAIKVTRDYLRTILEKRICNVNNLNKLLTMLLRENAELKEKSHQVPFFPHHLSKLGVNVKVDTLAKFCELYELYRSDPERRLLEKETHLVEMSVL